MRNRLHELLDQVRNAQVQLGEARVRIKRSQREVALEEAWIQTIERRLVELNAQVAEVVREQTRTTPAPGANHEGRNR